jgi:4-amino-4-deoxy-L-arabinose transferase-like glycosyltransferase
VNRGPLERWTGRPWAWAALALAVRIAAVLLGPGPGAEPWSDSVDYHRLAAHLAAGLGFALGPEGALYPTTFRPPLLPLLVAPVYAVAGPHYVLALLVQCVLSALTVPVLWALVRETAGPVRGPAAARLAAALFVVWPPLVYLTTVLLTETLAALLVTVSLLLAVRLFARGGGVLALGLGVSLGLAALARPTALPLAGALAAWLLLAPRRPFSRRAIEVALVAGALVLAIGPWTLRNHRVSGSWVAVTSGGGAALWDSNNPLVVADPRWRGGALSLREVDPYAQEFAGRSEVEIDRLSAARARAFLAQNRNLWPRLAAWKLVRLFRITSETPVTGRLVPPGSPLAPLVGLLDPLLWTWGLLLPFFVGALFAALARPRKPAFAPALAVVTVALLAIVYWGSLRMRAPVEPAILALGSTGVVAVLQRLRRPRAGAARCSV